MIPRAHSGPYQILKQTTNVHSVHKEEKPEKEEEKN